MSYPWQPDLDECLAITEALRDYLAGLQWAVGKTVDRCIAEWAAPEQKHEYPAIVVMPIRDGDYQDTNPVPLGATKQPALGPGHVLMRDAEFTSENCEIQIVATDPVMRSLVVRAVRERLRGHSVDGTYDQRIPVPRYYGGPTSMTVWPRRVRHEDTNLGAEGRYRIAYLTCHIRLPVLRVEGVTTLLPKFVVKVDGGDGEIRAVA